MPAPRMSPTTNSSSTLRPMARRKVGLAVSASALTCTSWTDPACWFGPVWPGPPLRARCEGLVCHGLGGTGDEDLYAVLVGLQVLEGRELGGQERRGHEVAGARLEPAGELVGRDDEVHEPH